MNLTFKKQDRLLTSKEFKQVFNRPIKKIHSEHLILFVAQGENLPRLGLAITKKKLKRAVERNHLKRLCREVFRQQKEYFQALDMVLIVKRSYGDSVDIRGELDILFNKIKISYKKDSA